jgi:hypothetical protein
MGDALKPYFDDVMSVVVAQSGHFVLEELIANLCRSRFDGEKTVITHLALLHCPAKGKLTLFLVAG